MLTTPNLYDVLRAAMTPGWEIRMMSEPAREILGVKSAPVDLAGWTAALVGEQRGPLFRVQALQGGFARHAVTVVWYDRLVPFEGENG